MKRNFKHDIHNNGFLCVWEACLLFAIDDYKAFVRNGYIVGDKITDKANHHWKRSTNKRGYGGTGDLQQLINFIKNDMDDILIAVGIREDADGIRRKIGFYNK